MLIDCNLLSEPYSNSYILTSTKSLTHRFAFRPWLTESIERCFKNFGVAFWGIKSLTNMEDVVAEMIQKFEVYWIATNLCFVGQQRNARRLLRTLGCQSGEKKYCPKCGISGRYGMRAIG